MTKEEYKNKLEKIKLKNEEIKLKNKLRAEKNKYKRFSLSKMKTSNKVLVVSVFAIILFTVACLYIQYKGNAISDTLVTSWYAFWTIEIISLAGIKISKVVKNRNAETAEESVENCEQELCG
jgi:uncharacterized membrane protein (DUF106 family)